MFSIDPILQKVDQIKNEDKPVPGLSRTRSGVACLIVGTLVGLMIGHSRNWNLFYSAIGGGVVGGVVGTMLVPKE